MSVRLRSPSRRGPPRISLVIALGLALCGAAADVRAEDQTAAEALFDKGRKLMESNATLAEACRTLEQSLKLMDRGDTMLNLAECHRRQGKTATAWSEFDRALTYGFKVGFTEAIQTATKLRDTLALKLSKLTVTVPPATAALEGLTVEVLGKPWPRERWNTGFIIDPGPARVTARAKGYKPFEVQVDIGADKDAKTVVVVLEVEPPPPTPPTPTPPPPGPVAPRPLWPWFVGAVGVALGGVAIGGEIVSVGAGNELNAQCGSTRKNCPHGYDFSPARSRELVGFGLFAGMGTAGLLALGAAGVGFALPPRAPTQAQTPGTSLVVSPTTIAVRSTF